MAKFNMKDYEMAMLEEERQDRLQEELENRREKESWEAEANWRDYQRNQEEDKLAEMMYEDDDCYYPECEEDPYGPEYDPCDLLDEYDPYGDLLDEDIPCESDDYYPTAEDLYDMYAYASEEEYCGEGEDVDSCEFCYLYPKCDMCSCYPCQYSFEMHTLSENIYYMKDIEAERIARKAVARNRHHASEKAKRRSKKSASILERRLRKSDFRLPYEEYRLCTRAYAAIKKANRIKTS